MITISIDSERPAEQRSITRGFQQTPSMMRQGAFARTLAGAGRYGDDHLAHISGEEAELLRRRGGAGTRNPRTGLREYFIGSAEQASREPGISTSPTGGASGFQAFGGTYGSGPGRAPTSVGIPGTMGYAALDGARRGGTDSAFAAGGGGQQPSTRGFNILGRPFGLNAENVGGRVRANWNPVQAATMGLFSPDFANISVGSGFSSGGTNLGGSATDSVEDARIERQRAGRALLNAVLPEEPEEAATAEPEPAPPPRFVPFTGDYTTYGQPGGVPSHRFFE